MRGQLGRNPEKDRMVKLRSEYGQDLSNKMKVSVLCPMPPKDLQEGVLDE